MNRAHLTRIAGLAVATALLTLPATGSAGKGKKHFKVRPGKTVAGEKLPDARGPRMDVVFVIDSTGSMGGEIEAVKSEVNSMVGGLLAGTPRPDVRFGVVDYRDKGDEFRVRTFELSRNSEALHDFVKTIHAAGGGDGPESVNLALQTSVEKMAWDKDKNTAKVVFLLGDAPGHAYSGEKHYKEIAKTAKADGIVINTIACRTWAEMMTQWKEIAELTGGEFSSLKYSSEIVTADGKKKTVITEGDRTVVADGTLSDEDWGKDIATLEKEGRVREAKPEEMGGRYGGPMGGEMGYGAVTGSGPMPAATRGTGYGGGGKSDVARKMLDSMKKVAEEKGVTY